MMMAHLEGALRFEERVGVTSYDIKGLSGVGLPRHRRIRVDIKSQKYPLGSGCQTSVISCL